MELTEKLYQQYVLKNYGLPPLTLVKGEGSTVWDEEGNAFLDFTSGVAVNSIGHGNPKWVSAIRDQVGQLAHCSNLFRNQKQAQLAQKLVQKIGPGQVFFCNSGAEANETLIKTARLFGREKAGCENKIITVISAENAFHGRTYGGMSATPQEKIQGGFRPMLPGFVHAEFNNFSSFVEKIDENTAAIMIEPVQGESGIIPADPGFMRELRALCDRHQILLLVDEVQTGIGRTGKFLALEHSGIQADAIALAKGLGGGFPIGAVWISEKHTHLFQAGSHGSTFGGNPMACAAALAVLDVLEEGKIIPRTAELGEHFKNELGKIEKAFPQLVKEVRGLGFHIGVSMREDPLPIMNKLREKGLLTVKAGLDTIRFLPALTVQESDLEKALSIFRSVLAERSNA